MLFIKSEKQNVLIKLRYNDLIMMNNALNEVCNGFYRYINDFEKKIGCKREIAMVLLSSICMLIDTFNREKEMFQLPQKNFNKKDEDHTWQFEIKAENLLIIKNALRTVCQHYPGSEIHTYTGFTHDEIEKLISEMLTVLDQYNAIKKPEAPEIM